MKKLLKVAILALAVVPLASCLELALLGIDVRPCNGGIADAGICVQIKGDLCICDHCGGYADDQGGRAGPHTFKNGGPSQGPCPGIGGPCTPSGLAHDHEYEVPPAMLYTAPTGSASTTNPPITGQQIQ